MDIGLLSKMVKDLILDNDQVTLPGLGDFVAQMMPASFSDKGYTINPPYRTLVFRRTLTPDTLLVDFYSKANEVDESVARTILGDFLSELKVVLQTNKAVVFPGLGKLRAAKGNQYFFIADEELDIFPAGEGMEPVSMKTHKQALPANALAGLDALVATPARSVEQSPEPVMEQTPTAESPEPVMEQTSTAESQEPVEETAVEPVRIQAGTPEHPRDVDLTAKLMARPDHKRHHRKRYRLPGYVKIIVLAVVLLILLLAAFAVAGRLCPDFIDKILYNEQERELIQLMGRI